MEHENIFLLHALYMGAFITFVYDLLRIFRRVVPHRGFFVSAEDLFFWIYCGGEVFLLMYRESDGTLRWFAVAGALTGMFLYRKLVSRYFVSFVSAALSRIIFFMGKLLNWLLKPVRSVVRRAGSETGKAGRKARRGLKRFGKAVKYRLTYYLKRLKMAVKT